MAGLTGCGASVNSNFVQPQQTYDLTVTIRQKIWGRDHPDTAYSLNNLGWIYLELGRWQLAEPLLKENLAIPRAPSARAGPLYVSSLANWGRVLEQKGDYSGAADAFNQAMQLLASGGHQESWSGPKSWTIRSFSISIAAAIRMQSGWPRVRCRWRGTWAATTIRS
jgi:tetratricopeptide (TPR) repeat protein